MSTDVVPVLRVADAEAAIDWYARIGFEVVFRHRFGEGMPWYVGIRRDDAQIHLSEHAGDAPGPSLLYVWVDDLDALAEHFGAAPDDQPWGRDVEVPDPDGNRLRFAQANG